jgi:hypothetical protein
MDFGAMSLFVGERGGRLTPQSGCEVRDANKTRLKRERFGLVSERNKLRKSNKNKKKKECGPGMANG